MSGFRVMGQNSCEISIPVLALGDDWVTGDPIEIQVVESKFLFLRSSRFKVSSVQFKLPQAVAMCRNQMFNIKKISHTGPNLLEIQGGTKRN